MDHLTLIAELTLAGASVCADSFRNQSRGFGHSPGYGNGYGYGYGDGYGVGDGYGGNGDGYGVGDGIGFGNGCDSDDGHVSSRDTPREYRWTA